jgi:hypothetical protein
MRAYLAIGLGFALGAGVFAACFAGGEDAFSAGSAGKGSGSVGSGPGSGGSDIDGGMGGRPPSELTFTELCGDACLPGTGMSAPCEGGGGGGGSGGAGTGGAGDECTLAVDEGGDVAGSCGTPNEQAATGDPCLAAENCPAGHGCVGAPGRCLPYCCGSLEDCPLETYCDPTAIAAGDVPEGVDPPLIPVCVAATGCELLQPCPEKGLACTIVRSDGTTSCVEPGDGQLGDSCETLRDCAEGYICSPGARICLKLCHINMPEDCPGEAPTCQGGATTYPEGFGVCVES